MKSAVPLQMNWYDDILLYPMPVCVITSQDARGRVNAGAYSLVFPWSGLEERPQIVFLSRADSRTATNVVQTREFVVNYIPRSFLRDVVAVGQITPPEVDKLALTRFSLAPSTRVHVPGIQQAVFLLECTLDQVIHPSDIQTNLIGTIVHAAIEAPLLEMDKGKRLRRADLAVFFGYDDGDYYFCSLGRPQVLPARPELAKTKHLPPLAWDPAAEELLQRVPAIFRANVRRTIESKARARGKERITAEVVKEIQREMGTG
jgi:flavin reductase (DIM6/NTAB) family NADH-FMN oxidoreductase RutF